MTSTVPLDVTHEFTTDSVEEDGDSDCESLAASTTNIIETRKVLPSQQYVEEKVG